MRMRFLRENRGALQEMVRRNVGDYPWFTLGDFLRTLWVTELFGHLIFGMLWGFFVGGISRLWLDGSGSFWLLVACGIVGFLLAGTISTIGISRMYVKAYREVKAEGKNG